MPAFGAVAGMQAEGFVGWHGEFDEAALAAGGHSHGDGKGLLCGW